MADVRIRYIPGARFGMLYRPAVLLVTVIWVPSSVTFTPWRGTLLSVPVMTPVIRPVSPCAAARERGTRSVQAASTLTVMSRRFMMGDAP